MVGRRVDVSEPEATLDLGGVPDVPATVEKPGFLAVIDDELSRAEQQFLIGLFHAAGDFAKAHMCVEGILPPIDNPKEHLRRGIMIWQNPLVQSEYLRLSGDLGSRDGPLFLGALMSMHSIASGDSPPEIKIKAAQAMFKAMGEKTQITQVSDFGPNLAECMARITGIEGAKKLEDHEAVEATFEEVKS